MKTKGIKELSKEIGYNNYLCIKNSLSHTAETTGKEHFYNVRILHFDSFNIKQRKNKNSKHSFRIKFYNNDTSFIKLEKKSKIRELVYKKEIEISKEECEQILNGKFDAIQNKKEKLFREFYKKLKRNLIQPKNIIDYKREAYIFKADDARVTIDRDIKSSANISDFLKDSLYTMPIPQTIILQIKYDKTIPESFRKTISFLNKKEPAAKAFSKQVVEN